MRATIVLALASAALAGSALAQTAQPPRLGSRPAPEISWGKAGVSLADYRADSVACATRGYELDVSQSEAAKVLVEGSKKIEALHTADNDPAVAMENAIRTARVIEGVRPAARMREVAGLLQTTVDQCLAERGYARFRLTEEQRDRLERLPIGAAERHSYLHSLAADPAVLKAQALAPASSSR
jgi:hypothetical protein